MKYFIYEIRKSVVLRLCLWCICIGLTTSISLADIIITEDDDQGVYPNYTWYSSISGYVGYKSNGTLTANNGTDISANKFYLGYYSGITGEATITDEDTDMTLADDLRVGNYGTGILSIKNGAELTCNRYAWVGYSGSSNGTVTIDGAGSTWTNTQNVRIGASGTGVLNITNGGTFNNESYCEIGDYESASGSVTVDGEGSLWTNSSFIYIASNGTGSLSITNGGKVVNENSSLGGVIAECDDSSGTVTIDGKGSTWLDKGKLIVGMDGLGVLSVTNGGTLSSCSDGGDAVIGRNSGARGMVTIDGKGSRWNNAGDLYAGHTGYGILNITNGGTVTTAGDSNISVYSRGTVTVDGIGSKWITKGYLTVGFKNYGTLNISEGGLVSAAGGLRIWNYSSYGEINMSTGGMLALKGEAFNSIAEFFGLIDDSNRINYWDDSINDWSLLTSETSTDYYSLTYYADDSGCDLAGFTVLTVGEASPVPEPSTIILLAAATGLGLLRRRRT